MPELEGILPKDVQTVAQGLLGESADDQTSAVTSKATGPRSPVESTDQPWDPVQPEPSQALLGQEVELAALTYAERKKKISRDKRYERYEHVLALHRAGLGQRAIARELQMSRRIVQRFLTAEAFPERAPGSGIHPKGQSKFDLHLAYLRERWNTGEHSGSRLFGEIKERGSTGSASLLRRLLGEWRTELPPKPRRGIPRQPRLPSQPRQPRLSSRSASFLMILEPAKRTKLQQHQLEQMAQHEDLHRAYRLAQEFIALLKERQAARLPDWLKRATQSDIAELKSFANGIRRDYAAVQAACSLPWSNGIVEGPVEGPVNRLKFLKRQMFGRAHLDLLRVKVLHAV